MTNSLSRGKRIQEKLQKALRAYSVGAVAGTRDRLIIWGITAYGSFVNGQTLAGFLAQSRGILRDSKRVYHWEDTLVYECKGANEGQLVVLATQNKAESVAAPIVTNLFGVGVRNDKGDTQSLPPTPLIKALLADEDLWRELPALRHYARRPIFDPSFNLCGPGWNAEQGILIHGPDITPVLEAPTYTPRAPVLDRLPPYLRRLLQGFCWASDADLVNAVGVLLTGLLGNHFVDDPKPLVILDGNQRGVGKTLFCQVVGGILDGVEPRRLPLVRDEELEKKLCAALRDGQSSLLFFDNVRNRVESALLEANIVSPVLSFRILGQSGNITRPNTYLWVLTSNQTSGTEDLISRGLPIRLRYEGDPRQRNFDENLPEYVRRFRLDLLGELAGLVLRWKQAAMPRGQQRHRCVRWAEVIGGILACAGLEGFLGNVEEAEGQMDEGLQALATLAEHFLSKKLAMFYVMGGTAVGKEKGGLPKDWTTHFVETETYRDTLTNKNVKGRDTWVGKFLAAKIERKVTITTESGSAIATLRKVAVRGGQFRYYFEMTPAATENTGLPTANNGSGGGESVSPLTLARVDFFQGPETDPSTPPAPTKEAGKTPPAVEDNRRGNDLTW